MIPLDIVWVGLAGGLGAVTRFVADGLLRARTGGLLPAGSITVNLSGSLLLGVLSGLVLFHGAPSMLTLVAGTGFCGGYTTFSTASFETVRLLQRSELRAAALSVGVTLLGALAAASVGLALASI